MPDGGNIAGYRLSGRTRASELGIWHEALSPDGTPVGLLRFDPRLLAAPGVRERLVATVTADRRLEQAGVAGLLPVADLLSAGGEVWLVAARPGSPAVNDLLATHAGASNPDAGSAATVLVETAQTLLGVHAAGFAHGSVHPGTVVIGGDGAALLAERGLAATLRGETPSPERDVAAWASLALGLAAGWAASQPAAAELFTRTAHTASAQGLSAARDTLIAGRDVLPQGFGTRERLIETIHWWSAGQVPTGLAGAAAAGFDTGEVATLLHAPEGSPAGQAQDQPQPGQAGGVMRFGPGVPVETTAAQIWRAGRDQQETLSPKERLQAARPRRRRRRGAWSAALLALIIAAAVLAWLLLSPGSGATLAVTAIDVRGPAKAVGCDKTVTLIGVITTNGEPGTVRYQWRQSDGHVNKEQTQTVASGEKSTRVPLRWNLSGPGSEKFTATLSVLSPVPSAKPLQDKATFSYKC